MKKYVYDQKAYFMQVKLTGALCLLFLAVSIYFIIIGRMQSLMLLVGIVSTYTFWNTYISKSNPEIIEITDEQISFSSFNQVDNYKLTDLNYFKIREFPSSGKMYLRIGKHNILGGRYWVPTKMFNESKELFQKLLDIEFELNPESIKSRARKVNTEYLRLEEEKQREN